VTRVRTRVSPGATGHGRRDRHIDEVLLVNGIRNLAVGALAGAVGTAAMDLVWYRRYRRNEGKDPLARWELAAGVTRWEEASAPGQLGQKVERLLIRRPPPDRWARPTTNLVHWATGIGWGIQYGALAGRTSRHPWLRVLGLGPVAWLASYAVLPLARVYKPIWKYDARTLGDDLSAHVVFGVTTGAVFAALTRRDS
jgi:hypothetical protein